MSEARAAAAVPSTQHLTPDPREARHPASMFLALIVGGLLLPRVLTFLQLSISLVMWPWQFDYDEGINLNATLRVAGGHNIYHHNGPDAFLSAPYTPLFYLLNAPATWIGGPHFAFGRGLSLLSTVAIALLLAYIVHRITTIWAAGVLSGMLWLSLSPVIVWSAFYKQDMLALALGLAGFAWVLVHAIMPGEEGEKGHVGDLRNERRSESNHEGRRTIHFACVAALLFALSFYTKQSSLSAAAACSLWLLLRQPRAGVYLISVLLALLVLPFGVANLLGHGGTWEHLVGYHALPWSARRFDRLLARLWGEYEPLLLWSGITVLGGVAALAHSIVRRYEVPSQGHAVPTGTRTLGTHHVLVPLRSPWALAGLYALVGGASTLVQLGYDGANFNHFLDVLLPACLLAGLSLAWTVRLWGRHTREYMAHGGVGNTGSPLRRAGAPRTFHQEAGRTRRARPALSAHAPGARELNGLNESYRRAGAVAGIAIIMVLLQAQLSAFRDPRTWFYNTWPNAQIDRQMRRLSSLVASTRGEIYSEDAYLLLSNGHRVAYDDASTFVPLTSLGRWDERLFVQAFRRRRFALVLLSHGSVRWTREARKAFQENYALKSSDLLDVFVPRDQRIEIPRSPDNIWGLKSHLQGRPQAESPDLCN